MTRKPAQVAGDGPVPTGAELRRMARPALRINHTVTGRESAGHRVKYFVDPDGVLPEKATPETVVLKRWRRREMKGITFSGSRLSPTLWRAVVTVFGMDAQALCQKTEHEIAAAIDQARDLLRERCQSIGDAAVLKAICDGPGARSS